MLRTLDALTQLHEHVEVYYVVDEYVAQLWTGDGGREVMRGEGVTFYAALVMLNEKLEGWTLDRVRGEHT